MTPIVTSADQDPVVIAVKENALAVSLDLAVQALDLAVLIHDPVRGLCGLPLSRDSTLIIDRELLPVDPWAFIGRLRARLWRGAAIVLTEDAAAPDAILEPTEDLILLEKPFGSGELLAFVRRAQSRMALH
jgi:hypothetical protein